MFCSSFTGCRELQSGGKQIPCQFPERCQAVCSKKHSSAGRAVVDLRGCLRLVAGDQGCDVAKLPFLYTAQTMPAEPGWRVRECTSTRAPGASGCGSSEIQYTDMASRRSLAGAKGGRPYTALALVSVRLRATVYPGSEISESRVPFPNFVSVTVAMSTSFWDTVCCRLPILLVILNACVTRIRRDGAGPAEEVGSADRGVGLIGYGEFVNSRTPAVALVDIPVLRFHV
eukprot:scpid93577/ scgid18149/ 